MSIGSVAISDADAEPIVDEIRTATRLQAPELKFSKVFVGPKNGQRRSVLSALLAPGGALHERASVYLIDKHYFVVGKLIDLFVEEQAHKQGRNIRNAGRARKMARSLFDEGPRALGPALFDRLLSSTVAFTSHKNRDQQVTVDDFYEVVEEGLGAGPEPAVTLQAAALRAFEICSQALVRRNALTGQPGQEQQRPTEDELRTLFRLAVKQQLIEHQGLTEAAATSIVNVGIPERCSDPNPQVVARFGG